MSVVLLDGRDIGNGDDEVDSVKLMPLCGEVNAQSGDRLKERLKGPRDDRLGTFVWMSVM